MFPTQNLLQWMLRQYSFAVIRGKKPEHAMGKEGNPGEKYNITISPIETGG